MEPIDKICIACQRPFSAISETIDTCTQCLLRPERKEPKTTLQYKRICGECGTEFNTPVKERALCLVCEAAVELSATHPVHMMHEGTDKVVNAAAKDIDGVKGGGRTGFHIPGTAIHASNHSRRAYRYADKKCSVCHTTFTPEGPNHKRCPKCMPTLEEIQRKNAEKYDVRLATQNKRYKLMAEQPEAPTTTPPPHFQGIEGRVLKFYIGQEVIINGITQSGRVVKIILDGKNTWYNVQYWWEGRLNFVDLADDEMTSKDEEYRP